MIFFNCFTKLFLPDIIQISQRNRSNSKKNQRMSKCVIRFNEKQESWQKVNHIFSLEIWYFLNEDFGLILSFVVSLVGAITIYWSYATLKCIFAHSASSGNAFFDYQIGWLKIRIHGILIFLNNFLLLDYFTFLSNLTVKNVIQP